MDKMKAKKKELGVDYIGGQGSLTLAEEESITQYLAKGKSKGKKSKKQSKTVAQNKFFK
jgi:hypothetical protein